MALVRMFMQSSAWPSIGRLICMECWGGMLRTGDGLEAGKELDALDFDLRLEKILID